MPSSPPAIVKDEYDGEDEPAFLPQPLLDDDTHMSDAPLPPSSPSLGPAKRKQPTPDDDDDEYDDDVFAVAEIKGNKNIRAPRVNISSARPVKQEPKKEIPSSPVKMEVDPAWDNVSSGLNIIKASDGPVIGKLDGANAMEDDGSIKMFWMDYTEVNGNLILFGKVQDKKSGKFVSAFLKVDGIMRNLFFLPREKRMSKYFIPRVVESWSLMMWQRMARRPTKKSRCRMFTERLSR